MISLAAIVIGLSIFLSMMQQVHYIIRWRDIVEAIYENAKLAAENDSYAVVSSFNVFDTVLSLIRRSRLMIRDYKKHGSHQNVVQVSIVIMCSRCSSFSGTASSLYLHAVETDHTGQSVSGIAHGSQIRTWQRRRIRISFWLLKFLRSFSRFRSWLRCARKW